LTTLLLVLLALVGVGPAPPLNIGPSRLGWSALSGEPRDEPDERLLCAASAVQLDHLAEQFLESGGAPQREPLGRLLGRPPLVHYRRVPSAHAREKCNARAGAHERIAPLSSLTPAVGTVAAAVTVRLEHACTCVRAAPSELGLDVEWLPTGAVEPARRSAIQRAPRTRREDGAAGATRGGDFCNRL
jgi:hypothetical protein